MAITTVATLPTAWNCKWSRPGYRLSGVVNKDQPESLWVCVRTGHRRHLVETDCESCPHWEPDEKAQD
jgi:hypothetical protein